MFTIGKYDVEINFRSKQSWSHFRIHSHENAKHLVWGRLSIWIENWTIQSYAICKECNSTEISEVGYGDESWTICPDCRSVEQGYIYLNKREYEKLVG